MQYFQVDKSRVNEFGFSGDMLDEATAKKEGDGAKAIADDGAKAVADETKEKTAEEKKTD